MMNPYQLSAERKLLGCLMDKFVNRTVLLTQIPERLFTGNNVLLYRAIESLHKAEREIDIVTVYKTLQTKAKPMSSSKGLTLTQGL
jgi:replicative DNA helicase